MPKKKSTRGKARPRRPRSGDFRPRKSPPPDGDVIDVEAEPVEGAAPRVQTPLVVEVKHPPRVTKAEREALAHSEAVAGRAEVTIARVRAVVHEVEAAAAVGREIGEFLAGLLRR